MISNFSADDNAPITFGTNESVQRAAVYADTRTAGTSTQSNAAAPISPPKEAETASVVETSYSTGYGPVENVRVVISTFEGQDANDRWRLQIKRTPNVIVGISGIPKLLSQSQFASISDQFRSQSVSVDLVPLTKITGREEREALAGLYSEAELPAHVDQLYLVLGGGGAEVVKAAVPAVALRPISTDLLLFDRKGQPFFATTLRLLAPAR